MNYRGQAALVDSLFFIAIVSAVCTGLFYFAINYGSSTESMLNSFYSSDFAMDSLKVITYINVFRDGTAVSADAAKNGTVPQFDYMLALIKEDFAKNTTITLPTKTAIANTLHAVLKPFDPSIDYVFFIAKESFKAGEEKYITMIIATRKCTAGCEFNSPDSEKIITRVYYSCDPPASSTNALEKYIFPYAGKVDSANGKISLVDSTGTYSYYVTGLDLWVAKKIKAIDGIIASASLNPNDVNREANFNCTLLNTS